MDTRIGKVTKYTIILYLKAMKYFWQNWVQSRDFYIIIIVYEENHYDDQNKNILKISWYE